MEYATIFLLTVIFVIVVSFQTGDAGSGAAVVAAGGRTGSQDHTASESKTKETSQHGAIVVKGRGRKKRGAKGSVKGASFATSVTSKDSKEGSATGAAAGVVLTTTTTTTTTTTVIRGASGSSGSAGATGGSSLAGSTTTSSSTSALLISTGQGSGAAEVRVRTEDEVDGATAAAVAAVAAAAPSTHDQMMSRVCRAALPLQMLMMILLGMACLVPMSEEEFSCALANGLESSSFLMLRYKDGPPPI